MLRASADAWRPPLPASDQEIARHVLPVDVQIGSTVYRAGVSLLVLVRAMRDAAERTSR